MALSEVKFNSAVEAAIQEFGNPSAIPQLPTPGTVKAYITNQLNVKIDYNEARRVLRRIVKARTTYKPVQSTIEIPVVKPGELTVYERSQMPAIHQQSSSVDRYRTSVSHG